MYFVLLTLLSCVYGDINVTRSVTDDFSFNRCVDCSKFSAYCQGTEKFQCCKDCACYYHKTFFKDIYGKSLCIASPGHDVENCTFHFLHHEYRGQPLLILNLQPDSSVAQIGVMIVPSRKETTCRLLPDESMYWNGESWHDLFTEDREASDFFIQDLKVSQKAIGFIYHGNNALLYMGLLMKLAVSCEEVSTSCLMFKFSGSRSYKENGILPSSLPTNVIPSVSTPLAPAPKTASKTLSAGLIVGIIVLILLLVVAVVTLMYLWRRKNRTLKGSTKVKSKRDRSQQLKIRLLKKRTDDNEVIYQTPDNGDKGDVIEAEFDNPGYLIPVDSKKATVDDEIVYQDVKLPSKTKKDPNYDYPELSHLKRKARSPSHEYARVSVSDDIDNKESVKNGESGYKALDDSSRTDEYQQLDVTTVLATSTNQDDSNDMNSPVTPSKHDYFELEVNANTEQI